MEEIQTVPVSTLELDPGNARLHPHDSLDALMHSLQQFGQPEPLIVQLSRNRVISGNGRLMAMRKLGWKDCVVRQVDWDDRRARAYALVANRTAELSSWNTALVTDQLEDLRIDFNLDDCGFESWEVPADEPPPDGSLDESDDGEEDYAAEDDSPPPEEPEVEPITKPGDVWLLGPHRLTCGDCLTDLGKGLSAPARLVFCDPPYGVTDNKWDQSIIPLDQLWEALRGVSVKDAAYVWTATQPFATDVIASNRKAFRYDLIWKKTHAAGYLNFKHAPLRAHESILLFGISSIYNPQMTKGDAYVHHGSTMKSTNYGPKYKSTTISNGERYPVSVIQFPKDSNRVHPTQKPVALLEWIVRTYTNEGDMVVDPTAGSGTTLIACEKNGRTCHTVEKEGRYCDIVVRRWEELTGKTAQHIPAMGT